MDGPTTERKSHPPGEKNRGLECRYCGCRRFRVIYTRRGGAVSSSADGSVGIVVNV